MSADFRGLKSHACRPGRARRAACTIVCTVVVRPLPEGPSTMCGPRRLNPTGRKVVDEMPTTARPCASSAGSEDSSTCSGSERIGGASAPPARRTASPKAAMARACAVLSAEPPRTATWTSRPCTSARPGGEERLRTSDGTSRLR